MFLLLHSQVCLITVLYDTMSGNFYTIDAFLKTEKQFSFTLHIQRCMSCMWHSFHIIFGDNKFTSSPMHFVSFSSISLIINLFSPFCVIKIIFMKKGKMFNVTTTFCISPLYTMHLPWAPNLVEKNGLIVWILEVVSSRWDVSLLNVYLILIIPNNLGIPHLFGQVIKNMLTTPLRASYLSFPHVNSHWIRKCTPCLPLNWQCVVFNQHSDVTNPIIFLSCRKHQQ